MKALVTGVAGFIAAEVARQLLAAGHEVVGVDNLNDYYDVRLKLWPKSERPATALYWAEQSVLPIDGDWQPNAPP